MQTLTKTKLKPFSCALILMTANLAHAQTCQTDSIPATTPDSRFEILNGGTEVKDTVTGLIWQRCSMGQQWNGSTCTGTATTHTWQHALTITKNLGNGYRLPNIKELATILEYQCFYPTINNNIFPNTQSDYYWSSSSSFGSSVWGIDFRRGEGNYGRNPTDQDYVRAVRSE